MTPMSAPGTILLTPPPHPRPPGLRQRLRGMTAAGRGSGAQPLQRPPVHRLDPRPKQPLRLPPPEEDRPDFPHLRRQPEKRAGVVRVEPSPAPPVPLAEDRKSVA